MTFNLLHQFPGSRFHPVKTAVLDPPENKNRSGTVPNRNQILRLGEKILHRRCGRWRHGRRDRGGCCQRRRWGGCGCGGRRLGRHHDWDDGGRWLGGQRSPDRETNLNADGNDDKHYHHNDKKHSPIHFLTSFLKVVGVESKRQLSFVTPDTSFEGGGLISSLP